MNKCFKCGAKKHTKVGLIIHRIDDAVQRVRCDKCGQIRMNTIKPKKAKVTKEINDGSDSNSINSDN